MYIKITYTYVKYFFLCRLLSLPFSLFLSLSVSFSLHTHIYLLLLIALMNNNRYLTLSTFYNSHFCMRGSGVVCTDVFKRFLQFRLHKALMKESANSIINKRSFKRLIKKKILNKKALNMKLIIIPCIDCS